MGRCAVPLVFGMLLLVIAGCSECAQYTPMPYREDETFWPAVGKTFVNLPVWSLEVALLLALIAFANAH